MSTDKLSLWIILTIYLLFILEFQPTYGMTPETKKSLKNKVIEMFQHAYGAYMTNAFPADELMPLSCKGRYRGSEPSRGDVDDSLGNFTLTLIDTLDTLAVLGDIPEFEKAVKLVINTTKFDTDVIVSVFETNIRVLGGLLGGHVLAVLLKRKKFAMEWYKDELLSMAKDVGTRLLPAFNTSTGIPYPRINLKHGIDRYISQNYKDTCTACAGTMVLEFAALSRLTGDPIYEEKVHKAMDYLWNQRHRSSDLVGTVINIHNGDWIRRESGVGAGIDSYYEYVLKAYILLGDDTYLTRFNKHYEAVMKYVSQGPMYLDVHMHRPQQNSRNFMDALLAFWPGLQVLKGDIQPAIEMHEMLYQVMTRHNFLPEAFTSDFHIHWGHHPLRPEFVESTYFLYKATGDPHYLEVGQKVIENLEEHARVPCGFAAIQDVTKRTLEDQMDSFVLAETFKYLFLLYAEKEDMLFDVDDYIFTTEAHLLPLSLSRCNKSQAPAMRLSREMYSHLQVMDEETRSDDEFGDSEHNTCPNPQVKFRQAMNYAQNLRASFKDSRGKTSPIQYDKQCSKQTSQTRLKAVDFVAGNADQLSLLREMGIRLMTMADGRIQLIHTATDAVNPQLAEDGLLFMQEMIELSKSQPAETPNEAMMIQVTTEPNLGHVIRAGPAQFGYDLRTRPFVKGQLVLTDPFKACSSVMNGAAINGKIAILERGDCMFVDKARQLQKKGAIGGIVIDHNPSSSSNSLALFAMSGDGKDDVFIPMLFVFHSEGQRLIQMLASNPDMEVILTSRIQVFGTSAPVSEGPGPANPSVDQSQQPIESADTSNSQSEQKKVSHGTNPIQSEKWANTNQPHVERTLELNPLEKVDENGNIKMSTGSDKVQMEIKMQSSDTEPQSPDSLDTNIISIRTLEDGSKQLFFRFDRLSKARSNSPDLGEIYQELVSVLLKRTNFIQLEKQSNYLAAIARLLEHAFYGKQTIDENSQILFNELSNKLEILSEEELDELQVTEEELGMKSDQSDGSKFESSQSEESKFESSQSDSSVQSKTHQYSQQVPEIQHGDEIDLFQVNGVKVKVKTKIVKPVSETKEDIENIDTKDSYANIEDFEESRNSEYNIKGQTSDSKIILNTQNNNMHLQGKDSNPDKKQAEDLERLRSINQDLADGLQNVVDRTTDISGSNNDLPKVQSSKNSKDNVKNIEIKTGDQKVSDNLNDKDNKDTRHSTSSTYEENDKTISSQKLGDL